MTVELPASVEEELRALAVTQSRDMSEILEEAVHLYIEASAITGLDAAEVAGAQVALVSESPDVLPQEATEGLMPRILLDMAEDIHPAADLRVRAEDLLRQVQATRRPIVLTQEGKGTAVLVDVESYQTLLEDPSTR